MIEEEPKKRPPKRASTKTTEPKLRRKLKLFRLPIPTELLSEEDPDVELRVTLSYFAEPNKFGRTVFHGLDLKWDMQGPQESEDEFLQRINVVKRPKGPDGKPLKLMTKKSFPWEIGVQLRGRGTVQSDRWTGRAALLAGSKLIAVMPVKGWWSDYVGMQTKELPFSLIVTVRAAGLDIYNIIEIGLTPTLEVPV